MISAAYIPPQSPGELYSRFCDAAEVIASCQLNTKIIWVGDFNQPPIHWTNLANSTCYLRDLANDLQLCQQNCIPLGKWSLSRLFAADDGVSRASDILIDHDLFHSALEIVAAVDVSVCNEEVMLA